MSDLNKQLKLLVTALVELASVVSSLSHVMEEARKARPKDEVTEILHREGLCSPWYDQRHISD